MGLHDTPSVEYARSGDASIAYAVHGDGPMDLVVIPGFISHIEYSFQNPRTRRVLERLSAFARVLVFDKRGTGMSDPVEDVPSLEVRMDDVRAVMDAVGSRRAALFAMSEGGPMAILFAATYPERASALVLYGSMARSTWAEDHPWAMPPEALIEGARLMQPFMGEGAWIDVFGPSEADNVELKNWFGRFQRSAASPGMLAKVYQMFLDIDVRAVLPSVHVPTLVLHRRGDRVVNRRSGEYLAAHIPGARYVELPGPDHSLWAGDVDAVADEIEEFLTGARSIPESDRVLATVMFTDIVGSTERAAAAGDAAWRATLERHEADVRASVARFAGRLVKGIGDGFLATFDGPARAVRCGAEIRDGARTAGLEVRVGLHAGECERMGDDVGGIAVHIAARVSSLAAGGEVLVSGTVRDLVAGSALTFEDRGEHALKGVPGQWRTYALTP